MKDYSRLTRLPKPQLARIELAPLVRGAVALEARLPVILVVNKVDRVKDKARLLPFLADLSTRHPFVEVIPLSAMQAGDMARLRDVIARNLPESPPLNKCFATPPGPRASMARPWTPCPTTWEAALWSGAISADAADAPNPRRLLPTSGALFSRTRPPAVATAAATLLECRR